LTEPNSNYISLNNALEQTLPLNFCITGDKAITRAELLADAVTLSEQLPKNKRHAINLCQDRYLFIVSFLAVCIRQQISLLPQNQAANTIQVLSESYSESYILSDDPELADFLISLASLNNKSQHPFPDIALDQPLSISFTSGSTGNPKAISKTWREFQTSAQLALQQLNLENQTTSLVSTTPMQHMFGLETCLFWVLFSKLSLHNSRPFYPEDIRMTLASLPGEKILISTPRHLKACSQQSIIWPTIKLILSSTAPLSQALAKRIEQSLQAPIYELFGSTETLSFASRQTTQTELWQPYNTIQLQKIGAQFLLQGGHIQPARYLDDQFTINEKGHFILQGRASDLIKVAGKRSSLNSLNQLLNQIEGVDDGVFFPSKNERLSAIVVSQLPKTSILQALKPLMDEVFLPRSLYLTDALPRNEMGKLIKNDLDQLIRAQQLANK